MPEMRRHLFTYLSAMWLMLCIATMAVWIRSYYAEDMAWYARVHRDDQSVSWLELLNGRGQLCLQSIRDYEGSFAFAKRHANDAHASFSFRSYPSSDESFGESAWNKLGFGYMRFHGPSKGWRYDVPHWLLALLFAMVPALWLIARIRAARRYRCGQCISCGYDVRATPSRCPECGSIPTWTKSKRTRAVPASI